MVNDSMLGGDEDDLEAILEECNNQVDTQMLRESRAGQASEPRPSTSHDRSQGTGHSEQEVRAGEGGLSDKFQRFMEQTGKLMEAIMARKESDRQEYM